MSAVRGDALHLPLPDESVDLIVTSPPYFSLRSYRDSGEHYTGQIGSEATPQAFLEALWVATREMVRVLKPTGSLWVNLGDKYAGSGGHNNSGFSDKSTLGLGRHPGVEGTYEAARRHNAKVRATRRNAPDRYTQNAGGVPTKSLMGIPWRYAIGCIDDLGLILRAEIIWSKPNGLPESVTDRVRRSHENWFHFVREPRYFSAIDEIREPHQGIERPNFDGKWFADKTEPMTKQVVRMGSSALGKLPGSVWTVPSEPLKVPAHLGIDHFAAFPQEWPRRLILGWSPSGICVECGDGRRPVAVEVGIAYERTIGVGAHGIKAQRPTTSSTLGLAKNHEITGYACACPEPTADTKPAVVLDPFGGTGTVALVARALGRIGISVDLSMDYCRLAKWRISQPASKVLSRTWHERQGAFL